MEGETFHETWNFSLNETPFSLRNFKKGDEFCTRRYKSLVKYAKMIVNHFIAVISLILYSLWRIRINPSFPSFKISPTFFLNFSLQRKSEHEKFEITFFSSCFFFSSGTKRVDFLPPPPTFRKSSGEKDRGRPREWVPLRYRKRYTRRGTRLKAFTSVSCLRKTERVDTENQ